MALSYSYPGLYIQEVPSSSSAIVPAPTSIAAFVGYSHPFKTSAFNVAQQLFSFNDYQTYFGPLFSSGLVDASLPRAIYQFFLNGGSSAWVVGLQPGFFNANNQIINRIGGPNGVTITGGTNVGLSSASTFTINAASVAPSIAPQGLAPASVTEGGPAFTLTVTGTNFVPGCKVLWNAVDLGTTAFVSATTLTAVVPAANIKAGSATPVPITVSNPAANTISNAENLSLNATNPPPVPAKVVPGEIPAGGPGFTLTISGSGFVAGSTVNWLDSHSVSTALATTFISDSLLTAVVTQAQAQTLIATPETANIQVTNSPGGQATISFTVGAAIQTATLSSTSPIAPASVTAGGPAFTLTVSGANFAPGATVNWNGVALSTTFVSASELTALVPAANIASSIPVSVTVANPAPAAVSSPAPFTINSTNLKPTVSGVNGLSPSSAPVNGVAFQLTVNGTNFTPSSVVNWNGSALPTTYVSDTTLAATVPVTDLGAAGSVNVTVSNPVGAGLVFTARELTDQTPMTVTIANVRNNGATFDLVVTYGNQLESYRNVQLGGSPSQAPDKLVNGISQLITVAPAPGGYGSSVLAQQLTLSLNLPTSFSTCFSASDFLEAQGPTVAVFDSNSSLDNLEIFNLLVVPGVSDFTVINSALAFAERKRAFAIVDLPQQAPAAGSASAAPQPVANWKEGLGGPNGPSLPVSQNGAGYFPYLIANDPVTGGNIPMAPSGFVAGIYAQTDANRGVWKAPAGLAAVVQNTNGPVLTGVMNDPQQGVLNLDAINCLRSFSGIGTVVWGARTLVAQNPAIAQWKYVPVRRMTLFIEQTLLANLRWVVFEPNDEPLWVAITATISAFMLSLFKQGALQGSTPSDAFQVKCDSTTTSPQDQANGVVNIVVAFAPLKPAEFVVINIAQLAGQTAGS